MERTLHICEIFSSIQGESTWQGLPCTFIRLSGCNLRCNYCDTDYSHTQAMQLTISEIVEKVRQLEVELVEITGGEPMMQNNVIGLIRELHQRKYSILLETNGSITLENVPGYVIKIMDIKCPQSGMFRQEMLENIEYLNEKDEIKFVLSDKKDYDFAKKIIKEYDLSKKCNILMSCVYGKLNYAHLADRIIQDKLPVRLNIQLHKIIWGVNSRK